MSRQLSDQRQAIFFAIDTSLSMNGDKIDRLNEGLAEFYRLIKINADACAMTDLAVTTFGAEVATVVEFGGVAQQSAPVLKAGGDTPMGKGVTHCTELVEKHQTNSAGRPAILVISSDGRPTDDVSAAVAHCARMVQANRLVIYPIAIGNDADPASLALFAPVAAIKETAVTEIVDVFRDLARAIVESSAPRSVFDKRVVPWNEAMRVSRG